MTPPGERTAIIEPGIGRVSYDELEALVASAAGRLAALGATRVGICMPRSTDVVVAILAAWRAGAAYVPLDPSAPAEYRARLVEACAIDVMLDLATPGLGRAIAAWSGDATPIGPRPPDPDAIASILFTSGSTGRPKGVVMTRRALDVFAAWIRDAIAPAAGDVFACHAPFHFAMSVFDVLGALTSGAALLIVREAIRADVARIAEVLANERATIWFAGPAILTQLARLEPMPALPDLRLVAFAGEVFPLGHLRALRARLPHPRYLHVWGSTETNVAVVHELPPGELAEPPPIGRPCPHIEARVVDGDGRDVAPGTPGELILRSPAVHAGYLDQPELTAEKRFGEWHRTGDVVIELPSGELRHAGRLGRMIKLRGYRIEPGEIEARLYEHPKVLEAGVVLQDDELVAHLRTEGNVRLGLVELKQFLSTRLPAYMIPKRFVHHDALPRTPNGKLDLQRLAGLA